MRAIVIEESLRDELPSDLEDMRVRKYDHPLDGVATVTIIEMEISEQHAVEAAVTLSRLLLPRLYYAHLANDQLMYVAFPDCLVRLERGDEEGERRAQAIGRIFDIPVAQMRFLEMFDIDHPDAPVRAGR